MNNIKALIEVFEWLCTMDMDVTEVTKDIYAELIDMGYLAYDLTDDNVVADIFLVDLGYECPTEDLLEFLVFKINIRAFVDSSPSIQEEEGCIECEGCTGCDESEDDYAYEDESYDDDYEDDDCINCENYEDCFGENDDEEEEFDEDELETPQYIVSVIKMDMFTNKKDTTVIPQIFNSLKEIAEYVDVKGMADAVKCLMAGDNTEVGNTGIVNVYVADDILSDMGEAGDTVADQIPDNATSVAILITVGRDRTNLLSAEMFVIYDVTQ